jgi:hypothetical protein
MRQITPSGDQPHCAEGSFADNMAHVLPQVSGNCRSAHSVPEK